MLSLYKKARKLSYKGGNSEIKNELYYYKGREET